MSDMQDIFNNFGIYLHVPFCVRNCDYCRFYKLSPTSEILDRYIDTISREINLCRIENGGDIPRPQTMFWGGGTPSLLSERHIESLAGSLGGLLPSLEWTVEVAPTNATRPKLAALKNLGVTRISMGAQSFNERTLKTLGRKHTLKATMEAVERVADAGFPHFSIDLIFGAENQTREEWIDDVRKAASLPVDHISAYCLEFESATSCCAGRLAEADYERSDREGDFLEIAMSLLPELGFEQYEISNYAKKGGRCLHNLSTWHMAQWLGLGAAAASQWRGLRRKNAPDFDAWCGGIAAAKPKYVDVVKLDDDEMFSSALIFGLRMADGIDFRLLAKRFPQAKSEKYVKPIDFLKSQGLLKEENGRLKLTRRGMLVGDAVSVELL